MFSFHYERELRKGNSVEWVYLNHSFQKLTVTGKVALGKALKVDSRMRARWCWRKLPSSGLLLWNASHCVLLCRWTGQEWAAAAVPSCSNHGGGTGGYIHVWGRWPRKSWRKKKIRRIEEFVEKSYTPTNFVASNGKRKPETWRLAIPMGLNDMLL